MRTVLGIIISVIAAGCAILMLNISGSLEAIPFRNKIFNGSTLFIILFCITFITVKKLLGKKNYNISEICGVFFVSFFAIFLLGSLLGMNIASDVSDAENRVLNKFPRVNPFHETFPDKFNNFVDDRVGLRIEAGNIFRKISPYLFDNINISQKAIVGKDNWLYINIDGNTTQYYQRTTDYTLAQYEEAVKHVEKVKEFCDVHGIKFYFIVPPNKATVYPEFYPSFIKNLNRPHNYKVLTDYLKDNSDIEIINVYDSMVKEKGNYTLYYKQDTHWNSIGAYFAYKKIAETIRKDFPDFAVIEEKDLHRCDAPNWGGDLVRMLGGYPHQYDSSNEFCVSTPATTVVNEKTYPSTVKIEDVETSAANDLKVMVFHDSFFIALKPFMYKGASSFKNISFNTTSPLAYEKEILEYKPDIVIWEILERGALNLMNGTISYKKR